MSAWAETQAELGTRVSSVIQSDLAAELAVLATFDPHVTVAVDQRDVVRLVCDQLADRDGHQEWMLKEGTRVRVLARILRRGGTKAAVQVRSKAEAPLDTALQRMLDAVLGERPVDLEQLDGDELRASLHAQRWCASAGASGGLPGLAGWLDRETIEGRLARLETLTPLQEITRDGVVGREEELRRLHEYVDGPPHLNFSSSPPLLLYGVGGVGKSTVTARFLLDLAERDETDEPTAWAYLDLDRPTLATYEPLAMLADIARQVGAQLPQVRRYLDYAAAEADEGSLGEGLESRGSDRLRETVQRLAEATNNYCGGRLVVVLDTYEELQRADISGRRSGAGNLLYSMFFLLSDYVDRFRLVVSGRAPALTFVSSQSQGADRRLHVGPFHGSAASDVLQHLYRKELERLPDDGRLDPDSRLDEDLADEVVETVGGTPLTLRLAAQVLAVEGEAGVSGAAGRAQAIGRVTEEFIRGFLYRRILSHIKGVKREDRESLQAVATAALAMRQVTADLLREVILPAIGRADLDPGAMLSGLMAETALADSQNGVVRLRDELRGPALLALGYDKGPLVEDVHRRAIAYYSAHPKLPEARVELAYHRLAMGDAEAAVGLDPTAILSLERSSADLPPHIRRLVTSAAAGPDAVGEDLRREATERESLATAQRALDAGDFAAAEQAVVPVEERLPTTRLHRIDALIADARGDRQAAVEAMRRDVEAAQTAQEAPRYCAAVIQLALLQERVADPAVGVIELTRADSQPWLAGQVLLRLELQLNRLAVVERSRGPFDRWVLELDVRLLLHKADPNAVRSTPALVRLLAATLGRHEPSWVLDAIRSLGLGTSTYSTHIRNLAEALGAWDLGQHEPGSASRSVGLPATGEPTIERLTSVWFQALSGTAEDTVPLLDRAFSLAPPTAKVVEALQQIYLWWGIDPQRDLEPDFGSDLEPGREGSPNSPHFLKDLPLDYSKPETNRLMRLMAGAYPDATDLQVLAAQVGQDMSATPSKTTHGLGTQEVLDAAARVGKLPDLIREVLADKRTASFHNELRDLVGSEWLSRTGIS